MSATGSTNVPQNGHNLQSTQPTQEEEIAVCPEQTGYQFSVLRIIVFVPLAVLPAGMGLLAAYWFPSVWTRLICSSCSLEEASLVIVKDLDGKPRVEVVRKLTLPADSVLSDVESSYSLKDHLLSEKKVTIKYFIHRHLRYLYNPERGRYVVLRGLELGHSCTDIHSKRHGLNTSEHDIASVQYGKCIIDVPVKPYHVLFVEEVLHPFYIFQVFSVIFWLVDNYYNYAVAMFFIATLSVLISLFQTRRYMKQLHDMAATHTTVSVMRNGRVVEGVNSATLVPGDVLVLPATGLFMPCDAALLTGNAIVNESMLTGESVPVTKTPLPMETKEYTPNSYKRHTLFSGTQVVQTRFYGHAHVLAVVIRTGFLTSKGSMVRSILFPKPLDNKFFWDSIKFVLVLSVLAGAAFIYTILILQLRKPPYEVKETILRAFDIITTVVPPSLPAALTVGTVYSLNRLRKHQIYCISPKRINMCGKIKLVCFDKTGTLTEDSLDLLGVLPSSTHGFGLMTEDASLLSRGPLLYAMATCHSLTRIDGVLSGDPLDMKMFMATKWTLHEPGDDSTRYDTLLTTVVRPPPGTCAGREEDEEDDMQLGILKQFTFSSELQRMSVIVRILPTKDTRLMHVFVKGAPEMIKRLSIPSTVPDDFYEVLGKMTQHGYRVLALGYRKLRMPWHHAEKLERSDVERDITFCGLLVMENKLKPETTPTLKILQDANIRTVMVTGDNLFTAVAVSRMCNMVASDHRVIVLKASYGDAAAPTISYHLLEEGNNQSMLCASTTGDEVVMKEYSDGVINNGSTSDLSLNLERNVYFHLAVDGKTFAAIMEHHKDLFRKLLASGTVFARMSPTQKAQLVTALQEQGYGVAMCGDGANDCGALKAAHAGVSLSDTEASIASPFTSKIPNISCMPKVIREGRAALVTSFGVFKFMALYSLTEFATVAILYALESNLGDLQYLYIDLILIMSLALVMGLTGPYEHLTKRRPPGSLVGAQVFLSLFTQIGLMLIFQVAIFFYVRTPAWFIPLHPKQDSDNIVCYENTALFTCSIHLYVGLAIAFSTAAPYRKPLYTNWAFMLVFILLSTSNIIITVAPSYWWPWLWNILNLKTLPEILFRVSLVEIAAFVILLAYFLEGYIYPTKTVRQLLRIIRCKKKYRNPYKYLLLQIAQDPYWPPPLPHGVAAHSYAVGL